MKQFVGGVFLPKNIVTVMDLVPVVEGAVADVLDKSFNVIAGDELSSEVDPFALADI